MHHTRVTDDPEFREMAKAVRLHAEDMTPLEGPSGSWCLPLKKLEATTAMKRLVFRFEKTKVHYQKLISGSDHVY